MGFKLYDSNKIPTPYNNDVSDKIPRFIGYPLIIVLLIVIAIDTYITILSINGLNKRLSQLEEITVKIKSVSDELGENIHETTSGILDRNDKLKVKIEKKRESLDELLNKQRDILKERKSTHTRLLDAFPRMKSKKFSKALEKLKEYKNKPENL